jgi:hypothetical protein
MQIGPLWLLITNKPVFNRILYSGANSYVHAQCDGTNDWDSSKRYIISSSKTTTYNQDDNGHHLQLYNQILLFQCTFVKWKALNTSELRENMHRAR